MSQRISILVIALALAGCGTSVGSGGKTGDLGGANNAVSAALAPYALVDLTTRMVSYRASAPDLSDPVMRDSVVVFRRVGSGAGEFFIGVCELTQGQWTRIAGTTPWTGVPSGLVAPAAVAADRPAFHLDYGGTVTALAGFTLAAGAQLTLPTSSQWEQATGVTSGWSWGATATRAQLDAAAVVHETNAGFSGPRAVASKAANALGIYDLHGNVWEWTAPGNEVRGGSWHDSFWMSRVEQKPSTVQGVASGLDHALIGVRLVLRP